ncbi:MAG: hydroxyethylthiazole kinase [Clostridiales bacterium]|nr:hydroxyethylthiazole kinase [Clostridiales bacterium]
MKANETVRKKVPLVHCITNYVTVNDVANALLACGGSPIMADDIDECADITAISQALVLNIGTLNQRTIASMIKSGKAANTNKIPVILDPVGAGASSLRNETTKRLLAEIQFTIIRGNLSEMSFIAGISSSTRGVDSSEEDQNNDAPAIAKAVAQKYHCVCVITGAVDIVTDGTRMARIHNGVPAMSKITGTGCMLSGIIGAYAGALEDPFQAACHAVISMGLAGEISYEKHQKTGTGSLHIGIIDALSQIDDAILEERRKITYEANC